MKLEDKMFTNLYLIVDLSIILLITYLFSWILNTDFYKSLFVFVIISIATSLISFILNTYLLFKEEIK
jgi:hypothetical protein